MAAARLLHQAGLEVAVILLGARDSLKGDAAQAWRELTAVPGVSIHVVETAADLAGLEAGREADLIIDAVLGTGFKPPMKGLALDAFNWIKDRRGPVLAVDLPSGWPADANCATVDTPVFPADAVITFTAPKPAHVFGALTRTWDQPIVVVPIGSPDELLISELGIVWAGSSMDLVQVSPARAAANGGGLRPRSGGGWHVWIGRRQGRCTCYDIAGSHARWCWPRHGSSARTCIAGCRDHCSGTDGLADGSDRGRMYLG